MSLTWTVTCFGMQIKAPYRGCVFLKGFHGPQLQEFYKMVSFRYFCGSKHPRDVKSPVKLSGRAAEGSVFQQPFAAFRSTLLKSGQRVKSFLCHVYCKRNELYAKKLHQGQRKSNPLGIWFFRARNLTWLKREESHPLYLFSLLSSCPWQIKSHQCNGACQKTSDRTGYLTSVIHLCASIYRHVYPCQLTSVRQRRALQSS